MINQIDPYKFVHFKNCHLFLFGFWSGLFKVFLILKYTAPSGGMKSLKDRSCLRCR